MMTHTFDDGSHQEAVATLREICTTDLGVRFGWGWRCEDCGRGHVEDTAQTGGILTCENCGAEFVDG